MSFHTSFLFFFFFNDTATTEIYTLSLHDALPILCIWQQTISEVITSSTRVVFGSRRTATTRCNRRSEEHTSELQSLRHLVCRLLLEKKKKLNTLRKISNNKTTEAP